MEFSPYGYGAWKFNKEEIRLRFLRVCDGLKRLKKEGIKYDCLIVHGTSGTWLAPFLVADGHKVVMVRKPGEHAHGSEIEGPSDGNYSRGVFVDDLICSGDTLKRVQRILQDANETVKIELVGVVLHDQKDSSSMSEEEPPVFGYLEREVK